jgi:hypothetical protein
MARRGDGIYQRGRTWWLAFHHCWDLSPLAAHFQPPSLLTEREGPARPHTPGLQNFLENATPFPDAAGAVSRSYERNELNEGTP